MGIEIPSEVTWLFPIVVGQSWPEGDETALRRMADAYRTAAEGVQGVIDQGNGAASTVVASQMGAAAVAFEEYWKKFSDGDESYLPKLKKICEQLAESCDGTALEVEYTKLSIIASLIALAIEIAALIAAAFATFGTASAGIPIAQQATRLIVQFTFRQLIIAILKEVAISVGIDAAIQGIQMLSGERKDWDWGKTGEAAVSGAVSGLVGGLSGGVKFQGGGLAGQVAVGATRGAVEGAVSSVGTSVAMGQDISAKDVLLGATSGAVSGSIGGAKDGITVEAPHINPGGPGGGPPDLGPTPGSGPPDLGGSGNPGGTPGGSPSGSPGGTPGGGPDGSPGGSPGGTPPAGSPGGSPGGTPTPGGSAPSPTGSPDAPAAPRPGVDTTSASTVAAPPAPPLHAPTPSNTPDRAPAGNQPPAFAPSAAPGGTPAAGPAPAGAGGSAPSSVSSRLGTPTAPSLGGTGPSHTPTSAGSSPSSSPGGPTPGSSSGSTPGSTPGGSTPGGSTPGGSGSTPGGSHAPASTPGGAGSTPGGSTPGGSPSPGSTPGTTPGGSHSPGSTPGGPTPGSPGGSTPGGPTPGAHAPAAAGTTPGGPGSHAAPGGSPAPGGFVPTPGAGAPGSHAVPGGVTPGGSPTAPGGNGSVPGGSHATPGGSPTPGSFAPTPGGPGSHAAANGTASTPGGLHAAPVGGPAPVGSHAAPAGAGPAPGGSHAAPVGGPTMGGFVPAGGSAPGTHSTSGGPSSTHGTDPATNQGGFVPPAGGRGPAMAGGLFAEPTSRPTHGTDAVAASSAAAPPQTFHAPQQTGPQHTGPQPGGVTPQPGGFGPQPGGFTPQPGGPAPQHAGPAQSGPAQSGPASTRPDAPMARNTPTEAPARTPDPRTPDPRTPDPRTPGSPDPRTSGTPDGRTPGSPDGRTPGTPDGRTPGTPDGRTPGSPDPHTAPDSSQQHPTAPQPALTPNADGSSPASSHQWPQDPPPASRGADTSGTPDPTPNAGPTADPAVDPHQNVWGNPSGVVENFSQDGPYVPIHESTGAGDREVGTYDQRVASIVEPTYQPYGSHGTFDEFMRHNTTDGTVNGPIAWPPNQGAAGARVVVELPAGTVLDRFGSPQGDFLSPLRPDGQPYGFGERAILPDSMGKGYHVYVLDRPMLVELATVAPAFDQPGGARQLQPVFDPSLADASGRVNLDSLQQAGVLHEVSTPPANGVVLPPDFGTHAPDGHTVLTPDTATVADAQNGAFDGPTDSTPTPAPTGPTPLGDVSPRVEQAIRSSEVTPAGVALHSEAPLRDLSSRIPSNGEHAVLDVHTDGDGVRIGDTHYTRTELVELINNHPDLAGRPIMFVGCDAAAGGENSIAAHVARETGQQVIAPDSLAWSDRHGNVYSSSPETTNGQQSPRIPPDGGWHAFEPDGTSSPVGENGMPPGHTPTGDLADALDAEHRGERDLQPQVQTPWTEPTTTHEQTVRLQDGQSLFDGRELPHDTRIEVLDENGQLRTVVHVDAEGAVSVDAIAPNTRDGVNPEIAHPHPDANYRVQVGNHNDVFVAGDDGSPRTRNDTVKIGGQSVEVTRPVTITEPPTPANGEQTIGRGHPLAPGPNDAFTARTDLPPNTRFDVTDTEGNHRGTVQTDENGTPKWVAAPENAGDRPNPEIANPIPGSNYNVDRGPLFQEFSTDATGRPEPGVTYERPQTSNQVEVTDLPQNRPLTQHDGQPLNSDTEYVVKDGDKVRTRVFVEEGGPTHVETESGQRGRLNPEMARAPEGADITTDPYYGTPAAKTPTWPDPPNGEVRLTQEVVLGENGKPLRDENNQVVRAVRIDGDTSGWTPEQRAAVERPVRPNDPFVTRDLPAGTRFTLTDERGPYSTFQSGENGAVSHVHTAPPFSAELNNPRPTAVYDVDSGRWKFLTDDRANTVASTGVPEYDGGTERRRDTTSQTDAGALAGKGADGRNIADGGHHQGKESGGPGELINVSSQQRDQNSGLERPGFVREETWYQMERDRAELESSSGGTIELVDTFAIREPGQDHPHTYQTRWRETLPDGRFKIHVRSYPNDHNAALWPSDF